MAKTYRLDLFVKPTSTATEQQVRDFGLNWVNERTDEASNQDNGEPINAYYCDVTDFKRGGKKYMIFGNLAKSMLDLNQIHNIIDPPLLATKVALAETDLELTGHNERITTLENTETEVEAVVI